MAGKARFAIAVLVLLSSCSTPTTPEAPQMTTVTFTYHSPVPLGQVPNDPGGATGCVHHYSALGGVFLLNGSWAPDTRYRDFEGDCHQTCTIAVPNIPVRTEHVVRMWDLGMCNIDASSEPLSYANISANGVALNRILDHPSGMHGVAFSVDANGRVTP